MNITIKKISRSSWGEPDRINGGTKSKFVNCTDRWIPGLDKKTGMLNIKFKEGMQETFEKELDLDEGTLNRNSSFWSTFGFSIGAKGETLNLLNPMHKLIYELMLIDPTVANSIEESQKSTAYEFVLSSEEVEADAENKTRSTKAEAFAVFNDFTDTQCMDLLVMNGDDISDTIPSVCRNMVGRMVEEQPGIFLSYAKDGNIKEKVWLKRLIRKGIITKSGPGTEDTVELFYNGINLTENGIGLDNVINFITAKANQSIYTGLKTSEKNKS
jgi:hypothetical protein